MSEDVLICASALCGVVGLSGLFNSRSLLVGVCSFYVFANGVAVALVLRSIASSGAARGDAEVFVFGLYVVAAMILVLGALVARFRALCTNASAPDQTGELKN